jgi:hypothetical protein
VVAPLLVHDAHELHPGVVLRVAPHATRLPHGARYGDTSASRNELSTPLPGVERTGISAAGSETLPSSGSSYRRVTPEHITSTPHTTEHTRTPARVSAP